MDKRGELITMSHSKLVEAAKVAINKVFSDTSVPRSKTEESLGELMEEIEGIVATLDHGSD